MECRASWHFSLLYKKNEQQAPPRKLQIDDLVPARDATGAIHALEIQEHLQFRARFDDQSTFDTAQIAIVIRTSDEH